MSEQNISKNSFYIGRFKYISTLRKKNIFNCNNKFFSLFSPQNILVLSLLLIWRLEGDQGSQFQNKKFSIIFFTLKALNMYLTCVKNIFNCISEVFLSLGPKKLGFFFFASAGLRKIKDHSLRIKDVNRKKDFSNQ